MRMELLEENFGKPLDEYRVVPNIVAVFNEVAGTDQRQSVVNPGGLSR